MLVQTAEQLVILSECRDLAAMLPVDEHELPRITSIT
jgi:hypothetical protein